jgi:hypothetical protein
MSREMGARYILPMHHSTFRLSREPVDEPIQRLFSIAGSQSWRIALTQPGQTWSLTEEAANQSTDEGHVAEPEAA